MWIVDIKYRLAFRQRIKRWNSILNIFYPLTRRMPLLKITSACRTKLKVVIFDLIWANFGALRWGFWLKILLKSQMPHIWPGSPPLGLNIDRCIIKIIATSFYLFSKVSIYSFFFLLLSCADIYEQCMIDEIYYQWSYILQVDNDFTRNGGASEINYFLHVQRDWQSFKG